MTKVPPMHWMWMHNKYVWASLCEKSRLRKEGLWPLYKEVLAKSEAGETDSALAKAYRKRESYIEHIVIEAKRICKDLGSERIRQANMRVMEEPLV